MGTADPKGDLGDSSSLGFLKGYYFGLCNSKIIGRVAGVCGGQILASTGMIGTLVPRGDLPSGDGEGTHDPKGNSEL